MIVSKVILMAEAKEHRVARLLLDADREVLVLDSLADVCVKIGPNLFTQGCIQASANPKFNAFRIAYHQRPGRTGTNLTFLAGGSLRSTKRILLRLIQVVLHFFDSDNNCFIIQESLYLEKRVFLCGRPAKLVGTSWIAHHDPLEASLQELLLSGPQVMLVMQDDRPQDGGLEWQAFLKAGAKDRMVDTILVGSNAFGST